MKKLLLLLAALSLVACSSNKPKEVIAAPAPLTLEQIMADKAEIEKEAAEKAMAEKMAAEKAAAEMAMAEMNYTVVKGDYLGKIASKYNVSCQELAKKNNISNPNLIFPGMTLTIPKK